jgi:septal ring factor EnvC (AmiA/AmiB activator)
MKKTILTAAFLSGIILTSCSTPAEKVVKAEENVTEASKDLDKATKEYEADIEACRKQTAEKIEANNQSLADFKVRIAHEKKETKAEYHKKMAELEQKNSDMKKKMDDYKADGKENWEKFKAGFNNEMDALGIEFKELTEKKKK